MTLPLPDMTEFRLEPQANGLVHLVFDCPDHSMNVFSNRAIENLVRFAEWLHRSDIRGVAVRSGKASGFCAGADPIELGAASETIAAAPRSGGGRISAARDPCHMLRRTRWSDAGRGDHRAATNRVAEKRGWG